MPDFRCTFSRTLIIHAKDEDDAREAFFCELDSEFRCEDEILPTLVTVELTTAPPRK